MRIAVVDDESVFRKQITEEISALYGREDVYCFHYSDGSEFIQSLGNGFMPDAVFLDIEMKNMDGMTAARNIRKYSKTIPIVFITSHVEQALEGYEVEAFRFLSKPVERQKLRQTLMDLEKKLKKDEKIVLRRDGEDVVYSLKDLIFIEASNNCVRFVFRKEDFELRMKFTEAIKLLTGDFYKCHRSYCINLAHVKKMGSSEVFMDNGGVIPISRGLAGEARQKLFDYVRREGR